MRRNVDMLGQQSVRSMGTVGVALALTLGMSVGGSAASAATMQESLAHQESLGADCIDGQFFLDVPQNHTFFPNINKLGCTEVSTGFQVPGGRMFAPKESITREATAAFLYRWGTLKYRSIGGYKFEVPAVSPFADVQPGDKFYHEITWLHHMGLATGTKQKIGKPLFKPKASITREAMAAFMTRYLRITDQFDYGLPIVSPFEDLTPESPFYKEINFLKVKRVTDGYKTDTGREFRPKEPITREAMAAFVSRVQPLPLDMRV